MTGAHYSREERAALRPKGLELTLIDDCDLAFIAAMTAWEKAEGDDRARVVLALQAYQSKLDQLVIDRHRRKR